MTSPVTPVASYRVQLTPSFGFDAARRGLDRLRTLGVSHLYLSPVTESRPGSSHGYDVVDHARVRDELGGLAGLTALLDALVDRGMAAIVDHVPNHVAIDQAELNRPWWDMLRDGAGSTAARWFDVDWAGADGRVLLPVLGQPDLATAGGVTIADGDGERELRVGDLRLPLAAGTEDLAPAHALERQHYRLLHWRRLERNVRRFFAIDSLAAVRVEQPEVATVVDTVPRLLADHPGFGGVRVDHIDGLADPRAYLEGLRDTIGDRWLVVEKILAPGETVPTSWPVDGTTGYDHVRVLEHALLDRPGWATIAARWASATGDARPFGAWQLQARREVLDGGLRPDRDRVVTAARAALGGPHTDLAEAVTELTVHLGRYRTYLPDDPDGRRAIDVAVAAATASRPDLTAPLERLVDAVASGAAAPAADLRTRWQQLTGPATAKGVEDRAFWRYLPLCSLDEVGGQPEPTSEDDPVAALHAHHARTQTRWPTTMLAGTTHDVKRSDDVRALGLALSAVAESWIRVVDEWLATAAFPDVDVPMQWLALQTAATTPELTASRLETFLVKAAREADQHSSWTDPVEAYERRLAALAQDVLVWPPLVEFAASLDPAGRALSLALLAVRATAPGIPDVYQGTEAFRFLLVDPDNRDPPHEDVLDEVVGLAATVDGRTAWADPAAPLARAVVLRRLLDVRRRLPNVFGVDGGYRPLDARGPGGGDVMAFARLDPDGMARLVTVVSRSQATDATVVLPPGRWHHVLLDDVPPVEGTLEAGPALDAFPAVVLIRPDLGAQGPRFETQRAQKCL